MPNKNCRSRVALLWEAGVRKSRPPKTQLRKLLRHIGRGVRFLAERAMHLLGGRWVVLLALGGVLLAIPGVRHLLAGLLHVVSRGDGAAIRDAVRAYGSLAPVASIALILLHMAIPLPAELMTLANGLAFGFWAGR